MPSASRSTLALAAAGAALLAAGCGPTEGVAADERLPHDPWQEVLHVVRAAEQRCDPLPRRHDEHLEGRAPPPACVELAQLPAVQEAGRRCVASGGTFAPGELACRCPAGRWLAADGGCAVRPPLRNARAGCPADLRGEPRGRRRECAPSLRLGGLRVALRGDEPSFAPLIAGLIGEDEALAERWALGGPAATAPEGPGWCLSGDLQEALPWALAGLDPWWWQRAAGADSPGTYLLPWRPHAGAHDRSLVAQQGVPQGRCRAALAVESRLPVEPDDGSVHLCAQLAQLREQLRCAHREQGHWLALYEVAEMPAAGLTTLVGHPRVAAADTVAQVQWLLAPPALLQRRLHLRRSEQELVAFVGPRGELIFTLLIAPGQRPEVVAWDDKFNQVARPQPLLGAAAEQP